MVSSIGKLILNQHCDVGRQTIDILLPGRSAELERFPAVAIDGCSRHSFFTRQVSSPKLLAAANETYPQIKWPEWSRDGKLIIFENTTNRKQSSLFVASRRTGESSTAAGHRTDVRSCSRLSHRARSRPPQTPPERNNISQSYKRRVIDKCRNCNQPQRASAGFSRNQTLSPSLHIPVQFIRIEQTITRGTECH